MYLPKISIVTPSFNQGKYLERTILSVIEQNYPNLEYIIIDGGSTDNSVEIIKKYERHLAFWISEKDNGQSAAINKGLAKCTGDIIAWLNSDDYYEAGAFRTVIKEFSENPAVGVVYGNCRAIYTNSQGNIIKQTIVEPRDINTFNLLTYWVSPFLPPQPSIFWLKKYQDKTTLLNVSLNYAMDLDFWLQLDRVAIFKRTNEVLSNYLIHAESKSGSTGGFEKFIPEWKHVIKENLKDKSFSFKFNYHKIKFLEKARRFFRGDYRKLPIKIVSLLVMFIKKITGIKKFGILTK